MNHHFFYFLKICGIVRYESHLIVLFGAAAIRHLPFLNIIIRKIIHSLNHTDRHESKARQQQNK